MQSEFLLPTSNCPFSTYQDPNYFDDVFFPSFASPVVSSDSYFPTTSPDELFVHDNMLIRDDDDFEKIPRRDMDDICDWIYANHNEGNSSSAEVFPSAEVYWSPCPSLESSQNTQIFMDIPMNMPGELDNELKLVHLSRAYGEAMDGGNNGSLAKVIVESINEKSSPQGNTVERVAYHMFKSKDDHGEYLRQESSKNFVTAFNVLYQSLICGRFAHNAANAAIIESIPDDATALHIVDFDIGEGIQWPALIEALSQKQRPVKLTSMKLGEDRVSSCWEFEETKRRLQDHGRRYGLRLEIEEKCIEDLVADMMMRRRNGRGREWLVFNLMVALPHMARRRRRSHVVEFLKVAEELLSSFDGIVTFGDGEAGDELGDCTSFASYFGKLLTHYQALFESLEHNFPVYMAEARTAMECTFLAPFMCPVAWFEEWKEIGKGRKFESVLEGWNVSGESLCEAKVMVNEGVTPYNVKIEGLRENEIVLGWKETTIVRVSIFCSRR